MSSSSTHYARALHMKPEQHRVSEGILMSEPDSKWLERNLWHSRSVIDLFNPVNIHIDW